MTSFSSARIGVNEAYSLIKQDDDKQTECLGSRYSSSSPSRALVEKFKENSSYYQFVASDVSSSNASSRYSLNWCNIDDYVANWHVLSSDEQYLVKKLLESDSRNSNRFGLKKLNLETHLLLNIGCDMNNILNNGRCSVLSNLKSSDSSSSGGYADFCAYNRTVDAKTCVRAYKKFEKEYSVETLFKKGLVAYQLVITSDSSYRKIDSNHDYKSRVQKFFRENAELLSKLSNKKRKIFSYIYSHEISVDSILEQKYRPHTHVIFFVEKDSFSVGEVSESQLMVKSMIEEINKTLDDRKWSATEVEIDDVLYPKVARKYSEISRSFEYIHRAYSLADEYVREARETNLEELNRKTVETYHNLIWLFSVEDSGEGMQGIRRIRSSHIPREKLKNQYKHPFLQKNKKRSTIKKEVVQAEKQEDRSSEQSYAPNQIATIKSGSSESCPAYEKGQKRTEQYSRLSSSGRAGSHASSDEGQFSCARASIHGTSNSRGARAFSSGKAKARERRDERCREQANALSFERRGGYRSKRSRHIRGQLWKKSLVRQIARQ